MGRRFILDAEADNLLKGATKIWCIVLKDIDTKEVHKFYPNSPLSGHVDFKDDFIKFIRRDDIYIGHNIVGFDFQLINKILKTDIRLDQLVDTLVLSRLFRPVSPHSEMIPEFERAGKDTRVGGHSLAAWGKRLGIAKGEYNDWTHFNMTMLEYCIQDCNVTEVLYLYLMDKESKGFSKLSIDLEHEVSMLLSHQELNGFRLDKNEAFKMLKSSGDIMSEMNEQFKEIFPPLKTFVRVMQVKHNKDGTMSKVSSRVLENFGPLAEQDKQDKNIYYLYEMVPFNAQSNSQIGERLKQLGWEPKVFTPKGKPKTDKDTLTSAIEELSQFPQIQALSQYNILADRHGKAQKWLDLAGEGDRVHGQINPIGAGTHRCSHFNDNMANIARVVNGSISLSDFVAKYNDPNNLNQWQRLDEETVFNKVKGNKVDVAYAGLKGKYGWESRSCWIAEPGKVLVGSDASGIQLRALAHYMNDPVYTKLLIEGDIHSVNQQAAGITANEFMSSRDVAKRFIYAWLLGAGDEKVGLVVGVTEAEADELVNWYGGRKNVKGLVWQLKQKGREPSLLTVLRIIKGKKIKKQFLSRTPALKRLKEVDIPKVVKVGYLVGIDGRKFHIPNAHLAMSFYLQGFEAVIMKYAMTLFDREMCKLQIPYKQVAFTHDEYEDEVLPEHAEIVGQTRVWSIKQAGIDLGSNCPLDGEYRIGASWSTVH